MNNKTYIVGRKKAKLSSDSGFNDEKDIPLDNVNQDVRFTWSKKSPRELLVWVAISSKGFFLPNLILTPIK